MNDEKLEVIHILSGISDREKVEKIYLELSGFSEERVVASGREIRAVWKAKEDSERLLVPFTNFFRKLLHQERKD